MDEPLLIGWKEYLDFPEWGPRRVRVKIDTGARTSALDVASYELHEGDGLVTARLCLALNRRHPERVTHVEAPVLRTVLVRNTSGTVEQRPVVEALVRLGPVVKRIRLTITNRSGMRHRMILGREALAGSFIIDVGRKYLLCH
jgi:hypothetical protein